MPTVPRRCRYDESRQNAVKENWRSSVAVFKPSGIGLHLNSLVKALPASCVETLESTENAVNSQTSSEAVDGLLVRTRIICASAVATSGNLCHESPKPVQNPVLLQKPISEHYFTACDEAECTELSPQKKRQDCMIFFHG